MIANMGEEHIEEDTEVPTTSAQDDSTKECVVCQEPSNGVYFGALVCLPCKSFFIRSTKEGAPNFACVWNKTCDISKGSRLRCQYCRFQKCLSVGMKRKEKVEYIPPEEGQALCKVCGDAANGVHFGAQTCEGCKKFFRRSINEVARYTCKNGEQCEINPMNRNICRYCRYKKCIDAGMSKTAIKMGRPKKNPNPDPSAVIRTLKQIADLNPNPSDHSSKNIVTEQTTKECNHQKEQKNGGSDAGDYGRQGGVDNRDYSRQGRVANRDSGRQYEDNDPELCRQGVVDDGDHGTQGGVDNGNYGRQGGVYDGDYIRQGGVDIGDYGRHQSVSSTASGRQDSLSYGRQDSIGRHDTTTRTNSVDLVIKSEDLESCQPEDLKRKVDNKSLKGSELFVNSGISFETLRKLVSATSSSPAPNIFRDQAHEQIQNTLYSYSNGPSCESSWPEKRMRTESDQFRNSTFIRPNHKTQITPEKCDTIPMTTVASNQQQSFQNNHHSHQSETFWTPDFHHLKQAEENESCFSLNSDGMFDQNTVKNEVNDPGFGNSSCMNPSNPNTICTQQSFHNSAGIMNKMQYPPMSDDSMFQGSNGTDIMYGKTCGDFPGIATSTALNSNYSQTTASPYTVSSTNYNSMNTFADSTVTNNGFIGHHNTSTSSASATIPMCDSSPNHSLSGYTNNNPITIPTPDKNQYSAAATKPIETSTGYWNLFEDIDITDADLFILSSDEQRTMRQSVIGYEKLRTEVFEQDSKVFIPPSNMNPPNILADPVKTQSDCPSPGGQSIPFNGPPQVNECSSSSFSSGPSSLDQPSSDNQPPHPQHHSLAVHSSPVITHLAVHPNGKENRQVTQNGIKSAVTGTYDSDVIVEHSNYQANSISNVKMNHYGGGNKNHSGPPNGNDIRRAIRERIADRTIAFTRYFMGLPGVETCNPGDAAKVFKRGNFSGMIIMAAIEQYDPQTKNFKTFFNWPMPKDNPMYELRMNLVKAAAKLYAMKLDRQEAAILFHLSVINADHKDLADKVVFHAMHMRYRRLLLKYVCSTTPTLDEATNRIKNILQQMPDVIRVTNWHNSLLAKMKFAVQKKDVTNMIGKISMDDSGC